MAEEKWNLLTEKLGMKAFRSSMNFGEKGWLGLAGIENS
jgi:hypothetical protein